MKQLLIFAVLFSISLAFNIRCSYNVVFHPSFLSLTYRCKARAEISGNFTHVIGVSGVQRDGFSNLDVALFTLENCPDVTTIPRGLLNFFPNLDGIHLKRCNVNHLRGDELAEYPDLRWFALESTQLDFVPGNFFASTSRIAGVSLGGNKITRIGENLLDNLQNLHRVYFLHNLCLNDFAMNEIEMPTFLRKLKENCEEKN